MSKPVLLVVDDEPENFDVIETLLSDQNYDLHYTANGPDTLDFLVSMQPDLILLDVMMPEMDGLEVCRRIKAVAPWQTVPIIMVTALSSKQALARCVEVGADDFISKPLNRMELTARVRSMLRIRQLYQQLTRFNSHLEAKVQQRTAELRQLLWQDSLTGLPSRLNLLERVGELVREGERCFALAYLDCDQFKLVNGSLGYAIGDQLLQAIARRLKGYLRPDDLLARVGEDEFCFLLYPLDSSFKLEPWIHIIMDGFQTPLPTAAGEIFMSVSLGIALADETHPKPSALLQAADTAMYKAKLQGKGCYQIFDHQLYIATRNRLNLENDLQRALKQQEFEVYYQPIVRLDTEQLVGFEALLRWHHPQRGMVSPGEFIPYMEETGLVVPVGLMVLHQACQQLHTWHQRGWSALTISVNLSVRQFASPTLLADIDQVLQDTGVNPACLKLEITESAIMEQPEAAISLMETLRSRHIQISIDDFGTGYSSLGYLHQFPIDILKIDQSFVNQIQAGRPNYQVVETIMTLSQQLKLAVIAEGIETQAQVQCLQRLGCEFGQGYLFAKPLDAELIGLQWLKQSSLE